MDKFSLFGIYAALEAMAMSGLDTSQLDVDRFGVMVGSGIGGLETIQNQVIRMHDKGPERGTVIYSNGDWKHGGGKYCFTCWCQRNLYFNSDSLC